MSRKTFDPQQQAILDCSESRLLVSAGAGSGKTTVMIQKIVDLLLNKKVSADQLLVVTFTNLASIEMRERLVSNLTDELISATSPDQKVFIQQLIDSVETASVDTIDGFCSKMLKKYFYQAKLDPELKIISSFSQEYYINKALENCIKQFGESNPKELIVLCDIFEKKARSLTALKENLLKAFNYCICQKDYETFLNNTLNQYKPNSLAEQYLNNHIFNSINTDLNHLVKILPSFKNSKKIYPLVGNYCNHLSNLKQDSPLLDTIKLLGSCPNCSFSNPTKEDKNNPDYEKIKFYVAKVSKAISDVAFLQYLQQKDYVNEISSHLSSFIALLRQFIVTYNALKKDNDVMDFSDLERKMLDLLQTPEILKDFHNTYKYIFVDEYQDINPMQDELINTLLASSSNLFLVGDVKQSIYGFRQSTPELFIQTYKDYKRDSKLGSAFDMQINFRSNPQILEFNNDIFSHLMTEKDAGLDYAKTSMFKPRNKDFPKTQAVEILVANTDYEMDKTTISGIYSVPNHVNPAKPSAQNLEAQLIVNKIKQLVGTEFYDASIKQTRLLEYRDIAILNRAINDKVYNLAKLLTEQNIPINISKSTNIKDSECVNKLLSLLKVINFTASDIDYTYLFTSPLVGIDYNELLTIYINRKLNLYDNLKEYSANNNNLAIKIKYGFNLCDEFRLISSTCNVIELINSILNKYHLRQHLIASEKGLEQLNILDAFLNSLSEEEKNLSISKFIDLIDKNMSSSNEIISRDSINSITIQSIHASKGLEYPVVILFNCGQQFRYIKDYNDLKFDLELGIGLQYYDLQARNRQESPTRYAITLKNHEKNYREELRLLYVATTRAKNKLIISGCCSEEDLKSNILSKDSYINLILSAYYGQINANPLANEYNLKNCYINICNYTDTLIATHQPSLNVLNDDAVINDNINFVYPYMQETNISIKNNVTALSRTINEDYNIAPVKLQLKENLQALPDDLADIGTKYHSALSSIDYNSIYNYQNSDDIVDEKLIKLAYDKLSPIAKNCINQFNEKQFMMYVPYKDIYPDSDLDTKILVQGVIDLILEFDDHIILVDYKYSNSNISTLRSRYNTQLKLYKLALERAFKKPVTQSFIYSIKTGDLG